MQAGPSAGASQYTAFPQLIEGSKALGDNSPGTKHNATAMFGIDKELNSGRMAGCLGGLETAALGANAKITTPFSADGKVGKSFFKGNQGGR